MKVVLVPYSVLTAYGKRHVDTGFTWSCACGLYWYTRQGAEACHHCKPFLDRKPTAVWHTVKPSEA